MTRSQLSLSPPLPRKTDGFTLVELAAAMFVIVVLASSLASSLAASMRVNSVTRERDVAREAARGQMEILLTRDFDSLPGLDTSRFPVPELRALSEPLDQAGSIAVDTTNPDLYRVTVTVDWTGVHGVQNLELSTLIADTAL